MKSRFRFKQIAATFIATLALALVGANLIGNEKKIETDVRSLYAVQDPQFIRSMGVLLGPSIIRGNRIEHLENGDRIFASMLESIRLAQHTITFETYIYWSGEIGNQFAEALRERARAGVKVHVLLDWVGSVKMDQDMLEGMKADGVAIERYHEPRWYNLTRMNNRTHRKILVVDGKTAFTGGVGIADAWRGNAQDEHHWRDSHFRVDGPVALQFQTVFMDNWIKATGKVLHSSEYFPEVKNAGDSPAQMFSSGPSGGSESMHLMYLLAIASAKQSILLSSSYFIPDELAIRAMVAAAKRGVHIQVITPGDKIDTEIVRRASRARWGDLLKAGIEIYEYQPTMFHCKIMIVDGYLVSTGSTNFDPRSFRLNDEANLNVYDKDFAAEMTKVFASDLKKARRITLEQWLHRPLQEKVIEHTLSLFGHQL